jgi:acylphosphatase
MQVARRFIVSGKVQGVGYRYFTFRAAIYYQLQGYVRNLASGQVEVVVEGPREAVEGLKKELAVGPYYAHVEQLEEAIMESTGCYQGFRIEH